MPRKSPRQHTVHTRAPRYKVPQYPRGSGFEPLRQSFSGQKGKYLKSLEQIKTSAKMSPQLRLAINEIIKAIESGNLELAYELSSVKSSIIGSLENGGHHFREDAEYNEKVLGEDIYRTLDSLNHDLAFEIDRIPAGMTIFTAEGVQSKERPRIKHPIIKMIERERKAIYTKTSSQPLQRIRTPILDQMRRLSKHGFTMEYLSGVYTHKGKKGLDDIEEEVLKIEKGS